MKITLEEHEAVQIVPITYPKIGDPITFVRDTLPQEELLCQLAEECNELAKAALKLRRTYSNLNPTPIKRREALNNLLEEVADVKLCLMVAGYEDVTTLIRTNRIMSEKAQRWAGRIQEAGR